MIAWILFFFQAIACQGQNLTICYQEGECRNGVLLDNVSAADKDTCRQLCLDRTTCGYFTYYEQVQACHKFYDCPNFDQY